MSGTVLYRGGLARLLVFMAVLAVSWLGSAGPDGPAQAALAAEPADAVCDRAARVAARASGVPLNVLQAVTRTETGRQRDGRLTPWPWTVNMEGAGRWFATREAARAYVVRHFDRGARSFDVGCFQINYKWHSGAFRSIDQMFEPVDNARYAAAFLTDLRDRYGSWDAAVGAYHSRTPERARLYLSRYRQILAQLPDARVPLPLMTDRQPLFTTPMATLVAASPGDASGRAVLGSLFSSERLR